MFAWQLDIQIHPSHGKNRMDWARGGGNVVICIFFNSVSRSIRLFSHSGSNRATLARRGGSIKTVPGVSNMKGGGVKRIIEDATLNDTPSFRYITSSVCWFKTFMVSQPRVAELSIGQLHGSLGRRVGDPRAVWICLCALAVFRFFRTRPSASGRRGSGSNRPLQI